MTHARLERAVAAASADGPRLDPGTLFGSAEGDDLCLAAVAHGPAFAAPRVYRARRDGVTVLFDGLPADRHHQLRAHHAGILLDHWGELPERLEGVFSALRVDARTGEVECLLDVLGLAQVYLTRSGGGWALSNSVEVLRRIRGPESPDPLGVSSMLTLGWVAGDHTMIEGIEVLPGGNLHRLGDRHNVRPILTSATVVPAGVPQAGAATELAEALTRTTAAVGDGIEPITCGLTAGRDSRVILGLARGAGLAVDYFTSTATDEVDRRVAADLARRLGLAHRVLDPEEPADEAEWVDQADRFIAQTHGFASIWGIADWIEHREPAERLGVKLWGAGGEIARSARTDIGTPFMANTVGVRRAWRPQRWVLEKKTASWGGLVTPTGREETRRYLDRYVAERREEGWRPGEVLESYYAFERVKHWGAAGVKRAADAVDVFTPFASRAFILYAYGLTSGQRYMEAAHHRLLSVLVPDLDLPFDTAWKPQRPRAAGADAARQAAQRLPARLRSRRSGAAPAPPFAQRWYEAGLPLHRELCLSFPASPLWEYVDRRRYDALSAEPGPHVEGLCRVLTAFWYFHGRSPSS